MGALLGFATLVSSSAFVSASATAGEVFYQPKVDFRYKLGNERTLGSTELFAPLVASKNELLFLDMRAVVDDNGASEGNLGFGYRSVQCCSQLGPYVRGVYGFFDRRRSANDNYFSQVTLGAEVLSKDWDFRANIYMPLSNGKVVRQTASTARLAGSGIFVDSGTFKEKALRGYDAEIGYRLFPEGRIYAGGYQFVGGGVPNITGVRGRLEWDVSKHINLGLESQHDPVRGNNSFAEVRLSIPFGPAPQEKATGIYKRMTTPIVRDIDVVTREKQAPDISTFAVQNTATGQAQNVYYVDNTAAAAGDGSVETPFDSLADAEAAAGAGDIIYVAYGDGTNTNMDAGITLNAAGQKLIGSGVDLTFDTTGMSFSSAALPLEGTALTLQTATQAPVMTNLAGDGITVSADNIEVAGLTVDGATSNGVLVTDATDARIHDMTLDNNAFSGAGFTYNTAGTYQLNVNNVTADANQTGFSVTADTGADATVIANAVSSTNSTNVGLVLATTGSGVADVQVTDLVSENDVSGVSINAFGSSQVAFTMNQSDVVNTTSAGVNSLVSGNTASLTIDLNDVAILGSGSSSFVQNSVLASYTEINATSLTINADNIGVADIDINGLVGSSVAATFDNLNLMSHQNNGLDFAMIGPVASSLTVTNSVLNDDNTANYLLAVNLNGGQNNVVVTDTTIRNGGSASSSVIIVPTGTSVADVVFQNNTVEDSNNAGVSIYNGGTAVLTADISNNIFTGNVDDALAIGTVSATGGSVAAKIEGNTVTGNGAGFAPAALFGTISASDVDFGGGTQGSLGLNRVFNNGGVDFNTYLSNGGGDTISAENNWWGVGTGLNPANINVVIGGGTIDADPFLATDPNP